jgi:hypothetical protein
VPSVNGNLDVDAMKTTRRTEIVFERDRTIVYAGRYPQRTAWCEACRAEVQMITLSRSCKVGVGEHPYHSFDCKRWPDPRMDHSRRNLIGLSKFSFDVTTRFQAFVALVNDKTSLKPKTICIREKRKMSFANTRSLFLSVTHNPKSLLTKKLSTNAPRLTLLFAVTLFIFAAPGIIQAGTVNGALFVDVNVDGVKQAADTGAGGLPVNLMTAGGNGIPWRWR